MDIGILKSMIENVKMLMVYDGKSPWAMSKIKGARANVTDAIRTFSDAVEFADVVEWFRHEVEDHIAFLNMLHVHTNANDQPRLYEVSAGSEDREEWRDTGDYKYKYKWVKVGRNIHVSISLGMFSMEQLVELCGKLHEKDARLWWKDQGKTYGGRHISARYENGADHWYFSVRCTSMAGCRAVKKMVETTEWVCGDSEAETVDN